MAVNVRKTWSYTMLCKTTMRAALAPVLGIVGLLCASMAGAAIVRDAGTDDDAKPETANGALAYAAETLDTGACVKTGTAPTAPCVAYNIVASGTTLEMTATTDILLPARGTAGHYYLRYHFGGMVLAADLNPDETNDANLARFRARGPDAADGTAGADITSANPALAYKGSKGDTEVIIQINATESYPLGSKFVLDLGRDDPPNVADSTGYALVAPPRPGTYNIEMMIYEDLSEARRAVSTFGARVFGDSGPGVTVAYAVGGKITGMVATADVGSDEGPFRRFVASEMGGADSGVLAKVDVSVNTKLMSATSGEPITTGIMNAAFAKATAAAGSFGIVDLNAAKKPPFMVSAGTDCEDGALGTYKMADGMPPATHDEDPDGDGPLKKGSITDAGMQSITSAEGTSGIAHGTGYFCLLVGGSNDNELAIPIVGGESKDAYTLSVYPALKGDDKKFPFQPRPEGLMEQAGGSIDRNGTTVNVSYLSTADAIRQRLVIINRGADVAEYWMSQFQTEDGVMVDTEMVHGMVPARGRVALRVWETLSITGGQRASGTIDVAAPKENIDVITVQWRTETGNFDTTVYQSAN